MEAISEKAESGSVDTGSAGAERGNGGAAAMLPLGSYKPEDVISEQTLCKLLDRCRVSIRRMVNKGELPAPTKLSGRRCWTVATLTAFFQVRLEQARREQERTRRDREKLARKVAELRP